MGVTGYQSMDTWVIRPFRTSGAASERLIKWISPLLTFLGPEEVCTVPQSAVACMGTLSPFGGLKFCRERERAREREGEKKHQ
jgi:hypothetical protein